MGLTKDLGRRIELVSMDRHFHDISLALYRQDQDGQPVFLVHTYSQIDGATERVAAVARAMAALGGVEADGARVRFPCGNSHALACRRLFLEACKADPTTQIAPKSLTIFDKKSNGDVTASSLGDGVYRMTGAGGNDKRRLAIGAGLVKLGEMAWVEDAQGAESAENEGQFTFPCGQSHDRLVGLLLGRAQNVRGVEREQQLAATRGQLLAPSAQKA